MHEKLENGMSHTNLAIPNLFLKRLIPSSGVIPHSNVYLVELVKK